MPVRQEERFTMKAVVCGEVKKENRKKSLELKTRKLLVWGL